MGRSKKAIAEEKHNYIARLSLLISADRRSDVDRIRYVPEGEKEYAEITFRAGHTVVVDITGGGCRNVYITVGKAVYG